jgi:hypothetical protein
MTPFIVCWVRSSPHLIFIVGVPASSQPAAPAPHLLPWAFPDYMRAGFDGKDLYGPKAEKALNHDLLNSNIFVPWWLSER